MHSEYPPFHLVICTSLWYPQHRGKTMDIHHAVRELRNRVELGPQVFATNLGLSTRSISKYEPAHTPGALPLERCAIGNFPACALPNFLPLVFRSLASKSTESRHISAAFSYKSAKIVSAHPRQVSPRILIYRWAASDRSCVAACNIKTLRLRRHANN